MRMGAIKARTEWRGLHGGGSLHTSPHNFLKAEEELGKGKDRYEERKNYWLKPERAPMHQGGGNGLRRFGMGTKIFRSSKS